MDINKQTKLIRKVITKEVEYTHDEKKILYKDFISAFKKSLMSTFYKDIKDEEVIRRAKNIHRIRKAKTNL